MIMLRCPWCGPRNVDEFHHVGEAQARPDPGGVTIDEWRSYLYERRNTCGWAGERWLHRMGCGRFLTVERHTLSGEVRALRPTGATSTGPAA